MHVQMEKRSEINKTKKQSFKERSKKTFLVFFCFAFLIISITAADTATKKMMQCKDDQHALGLYNMGQNIIRFDFAGEKYFFNIEKEIEWINEAADYAKKYWEIGYQYVREKTGW